MQLKLFLIAGGLDCRVAPRSCQRKLHRFIEEFKSLDIVDSLLRRLWAIKHHESLSFGSQIRFGYDVEDVAILREDLEQSIFQLVDFGAFLEISHIDSVAQVSQ